MYLKRLDGLLCYCSPTGKAIPAHYKCVHHLCTNVAVSTTFTHPGNDSRHDMQGPTDSLPWEAPAAGAGAGPSAATAPGGSTLQPWGDAGGGATAGASGGRERTGNAEITPLEVLHSLLSRTHHCKDTTLNKLPVVTVITTIFIVIFTSVPVIGGPPEMMQYQ